MGASSFENDPASDWFYLLEEAVDPGGVVAAALDRALGEADYLELDASCEAIAAAEISASCAGYPPMVCLTECATGWTLTPISLTTPEIDQAVQAVQAVERVRTESELRDSWDEAAEGGENSWLRDVDDLIARLGRSGAGDPATLWP